MPNEIRLVSGTMMGHSRSHELVPGKLYANLHVSNNAGKKVTLVWSEDDSPMTQDIDNGESVDIKKSIDSPGGAKKPSYDFQVREYDTNNNLLINGQQTYTIQPTEEETNVQYIEISAQGMLYMYFL